MKLKYFLYVFSFVFFACSIEDPVSFSNINDRIQNEGYFPLALSNSWLYEFRTGIEDIGTIIYDRDSTLVEQTINSTDVIDLNGERRYDYTFLPINLGTAIGSFIPSIQRITKIGNEYKKVQTILIPDQYFSGGSKYKLALELQNRKFLVDDPAPLVGQTIDSTSHVLRSPDGALEIYYTYTSKVKGVLAKMPDNLSNTEGIDKHLQQYTDILHTRDVIRIDKIIANENAGNTLALNLKVETQEGTFVSLNNFSTSLAGGGWVKAGFVDIFGGFLTIPAYVRAPDIAVSEFTQPLELCKSEANININTVLKGGAIELLSNQEVYFLDQYWVKGVGNIKSITSYKNLLAKINLKNYLSTDPFEVAFESKDDNCLGDRPPINKARISIKLYSTINGLSVTIPIKLAGSTQLIMNLKEYRQRKTLN